MKELLIIQAELKAPKNLFNRHGKYNYRNLEGILEAVKPIYTRLGCHLLIFDTIEVIGSHEYVRATARLTNSVGQTAEISAYAAIDFGKEGMDNAQAVGAASSYARKYALNGLFAIDDTKDADFLNTHGRAEQPPQQEQLQLPIQPAQPVKPKKISNDIVAIQQAINECETVDALTLLFITNKEEWKGDKNIIAMLNSRKQRLQTAKEGN